MKAELIARPTEYRGIQYRSKCEAMFAMWVDVKYGESVHVEYEPDWAEMGDYVPDFVIASPEVNFPTNRAPVFSTRIHFIEYKPSRPTFTYVSEICDKLHRLIIRECSNIGKVTVCGYVYYGSVYTTDRGIFRVKPTGGFAEPVAMNWLAKYEKQIRDYRFDLESEA